MKKRYILLIIISSIMYYLLLPTFFLLIMASGFNDKYDYTTDIIYYNDVIGINAKGNYHDKWGMSEEIFPSDISNKNVTDFKMVYYNPWDKQFLAYLVVDYDEEEYLEEVNRLNNYGIEEYRDYYSVHGFSYFNLLAMESDPYNGFVYAITDGDHKIIYVEVIFCNYYMDIDYEKEIPLDYLPDGFNAKIDNPYSKKMMN